jgi:hypothetical protein
VDEHCFQLALGPVVVLQCQFLRQTFSIRSAKDREPRQLHMSVWRFQCFGAHAVFLMNIC